MSTFAFIDKSEVETVIRELREENANLHNKWRVACLQIKELRDALEYYASPNPRHTKEYSNDYSWPDGGRMEDAVIGKRARAALKESP